MNVAESVKVSASVHQCVHYVKKTSKHYEMDGNDCFACDPTRLECPSGCNAVLRQMFDACSGVCLPDGYFFDKSKSFNKF